MSAPGNGLRVLIGILVAQWDSIVAALELDQRVTLIVLVRRFTEEAVPERSTATARDIVQLLGEMLPEEHPFLAALATSDLRSATAVRDAAELESWLLLPEALRARLDDPDPPLTVEAVDVGASAWLLAAAALREPDLRARGVDPDDPELIRLDRPDGGVQWPAFQFDLDDAASSLVHEVNRILGAANDPWGAADWWLGEHLWLADKPVRLLGRVAAQVLVDAAMAERPEV